MKRIIFSLFVASSVGMAGCRAQTPTSVPEAEFKNVSVRNLTLAALQGDEAEMRQLIASGANINEVGQHSCSPLCWAILNKSPSAVRALIGSGADPNQALPSPWHSPIFVAIHKKGPKDILELLLTNGGNPDGVHGANERPLAGRPLEEAALLSNHEAFVTLYEHGAKLHWGEGDADSDLLVQAILGDNLQTLQFLLNHGYCNGYAWAAHILGVGPAKAETAASIGGSLQSERSTELAEDDAVTHNEMKESNQLLMEMQRAIREAAKTCKSPPPDTRVRS
jgi:hypothetical protein